MCCLRQYKCIKRDEWRRARDNRKFSIKLKHPLLSVVLGFSASSLYKFIVTFCMAFEGTCNSYIKLEGVTTDQIVVGKQATAILLLCRHLHISIGMGKRNLESFRFFANFRHSAGGRIQLFAQRTTAWSVVTQFSDLLELFSGICIFRYNLPVCTEFSKYGNVRHNEIGKW